MSRAEGVGYHTGCIPVEPLATIVESYLATQKDEDAPGVGSGPKGMLCVRSKVNPKRLGELINRKTKWIDFNNADKLLCAINKTDYLLFHPELSKQYFKVGLSGKSKCTDWVATTRDSTCFRCKKDFSYYPDLNGRKTPKFCSSSCAQKLVREEEDAA